MKALIIYGTYSGGTREVAESIGSFLKTQGHSVTIENIIETTESGIYSLHTEKLLDQIKNHNLILLGSCTWFEENKEGQMHSGFLKFKSDLGDRSFDGISFAIFGLGVSNYVSYCGAVDELEKLVAERKGALIVPSLRIDRYYTHKKEAQDNLNQWQQKLISAFGARQTS